ncbi:pre-mRNA-processing factor 17 [Homalodisca vitripennis]|nr:pre-mRNA-processing factor 17 [Homalodisca vitripennis]
MIGFALYAIRKAHIGAQSATVASTNIATLIWITFGGLLLKRGKGRGKPPPAALRTKFFEEKRVYQVRDNFGYRFGRPQVDVCSTCEELQTKIKSKTLNNNAKRTAAAEFVVHKRRANKFFSKLQEIKELSKARPEIMGIVFYFMQNLPLPHLPVQEMFYLRKLWYYVFNIFDLKK